MGLECLMGVVLLDGMESKEDVLGPDGRELGEPADCGGGGCPAVNYPDDVEDEED